MPHVAEVCGLIVGTPPGVIDQEHGSLNITCFENKVSVSSLLQPAKADFLQRGALRSYPRQQTGVLRELLLNKSGYIGAFYQPVRMPIQDEVTEVIISCSQGHAFLMPIAR